jgi:hypothetical protein
VDLDARTLRVEQTLQRTKDGLAYVPPKTRRSRRTVPLPEACVDALNAHQERRAKVAGLGRIPTASAHVGGVRPAVSSPLSVRRRPPAAPLEPRESGLSAEQHERR